VPALVTAVIPAYNYAHFLPRAIDSVLAQTYAPIECVVVDDGSKDRTPEVLAGYGERVRAIRQPNAGLSAARNTGISAARGEYVALLDADDWWRPTKIAEQVAVLEADPGLAAVGCGVDVVDRDMKVLYSVPGKQPRASKEANLRAVATRKLWVGGSGSGLLARKRVLEELGPFDTSLRAAEDWDMWLRLFARYRVANVPEPLASIHMHGTGSFRNSKLMEDNQLRVLERAIARWPDVLGPRTRRQMRALVLYDASLELVAAGDLTGARKKMAASIRAWPFVPARARILLSLAVKTGAKAGERAARRAAKRAAQRVVSSARSTKSGR
jgi:GT2 family glycosyltransferase